MYRNYEYNSEPLAQGSGQPLAPQRRRPKRPSFFQRAVALVLCAALFGGVAGGSFYGVNRLLGSLEQDSSDSGSSLTSSVSLTSLSYSSGAVPQAATFELQNKVYVYKVVDGKASSAMIDVEKISNGREYIARAGLVPGDVIVAEGVGLLREGTPIVPKGQAAAAAAAAPATDESAAQTQTEKEE